MVEIGACDYVVFKTGYTSKLLSWRSEQHIEEVIDDWESEGTFIEEEKWVKKKIFGDDDEDEKEDEQEYEAENKKRQRYLTWLQIHGFTDCKRKFAIWQDKEDDQAYIERKAEEKKLDQQLSELMVCFLRNRDAIFANDNLWSKNDPHNMNETYGLTLLGSVANAEDILDTLHHVPGYSIEGEGATLRDYGGIISFRCNNIGEAMWFIKRLKRLDYCANLNVEAIYKITKLTTPAGKTVLYIKIDCEGG